jgi:histidinol-phosphate/aromatic aminotransferase/cobyric acid decarboxylase-like protein
MSTPDPTVHGGDGARVAASLGLPVDALLDLSASLNPVAPDPGAVIAKHLGSLRRYPDASSALAALADVLGVEREELLLTNGGAEAIALLGAEIGGSVDEPDFSLYPRGGGPLWRSNPNNPLGVLAAPTDEAGVWDEAFWPLATGTWTRGDHRTGAIVVGSLTKLFACPGLRVGYVMSEDAGLLDALRRRQPAWSVNGLVCEALPDLLASADLVRWRDETVELRAQLIAVLQGRGLSVRDTTGPWVLVDGAQGLREAMLRHGILTRDCTSFGLPDTVRIAVPPPHELARLEAAVRLAIPEE